MNEMMNIRRAMIIRLDFVLTKNVESLYSTLEESYGEKTRMMSSGMKGGGESIRFEPVRFFSLNNPGTYKMENFEEITTILPNGGLDHFENVMTIAQLSEDQMAQFSELDYGDGGRQFREYGERLADLVQQFPSIVNVDIFSPTILYVEPEQAYTLHNVVKQESGEVTREVDEEKVSSFIESNQKRLGDFLFNSGGYISVVNESFLATPWAVQDFWGPIVIFKLSPTDTDLSLADEWDEWMIRVYREGIRPLALLFNTYHWENFRREDLKKIDSETYSWEEISTDSSKSTISLLIPESLSRVSRLSEIRDDWASTFIQTVDERDELREMLFQVNEQNPVGPLEMQDEKVEFGNYFPPAEDFSLLSKYRMDLEEKISRLDRDLERIQEKLDDLSKIVHDRANLYLQNRVYWLTLVLALLTLILVILTILSVVSDGSLA